MIARLFSRNPVARAQRQLVEFHKHLAYLERRREINARLLAQAQLAWAPEQAKPEPEQDRAKFFAVDIAEACLEADEAEIAETRQHIDELRVALDQQRRV